MIEGGQIRSIDDISTEEVLRRWNEAANEFAQFFAERDEFFHEHLINPALLDMLGPIHHHVRVLDLGCGEGHFSRRLADAGGDAMAITAVDFSEEMIDLARRRSVAFGDRIQYHVGDAASLTELTDASFDVVVSNMALMDIKDYVGAVRETARLLRPGGIFVFSIMHPCFQTPGSGWVYEDASDDGPLDRKGWRICNYFLRLAYVGRAKEVMRHETCYFHRTLSDYCTVLRENGFVISDLREPQPTPEMLDQHGRHLLHASLFLVMKCQHGS